MRKTPRQERSRALVETILDAGHSVLLEHGYAGSSTVRIAKAAGISPGSLYQYFANKDEIVAAVVSRAEERLRESIVDRLSNRLTNPTLEYVVHDMIASTVDALVAERECIHVILADPRALRGHNTSADRVAELAGMYLLLHKGELSGVGREGVAWIAVTAVGAAMVRFALGDAPMSRDELVDELASLAVNYFDSRPVADLTACKPGPNANDRR